MRRIRLVANVRTGALVRRMFLAVLLAYFAFPLVAMARFAFQSIPMVSLGWSSLLDRWSGAAITTPFRDPQLGKALWLSTRLALGTVALSMLLLLPTCVLIRALVPHLRGVMELLSVLPYVVPTIALVAGVLPLKPLVPWFLDSDLSLIPFYVVMSLPFSYRALDSGLAAIDLRTLIDASRSLGAGWQVTIRRVIIPNIASSVLAASFLTLAVVYGEFTMARILLKQTLPTYMAQYQQREPQAGMALACASIFVTTFALFIVARRARRSTTGAV